MNKFFQKKNITLQILLKVFSLYLLIALFVTLLHMGWQYIDAKRLLEKELTDTFKMIEPGLVKALWDFDDGQVIDILRGAEILPYVSKVVLFDASGNIYTASKKFSEQQENAIETQSRLSQSFPLYKILSEQQKTQLHSGRKLIGNLYIYGSDGYLIRRLQVGFYLVIVNALIKSAALWLIFMVIGHRMLNRPLQQLIQAVDSFDLKLPTPMTVELHTVEKNELSSIEQSLNDMSERIFNDKSMIEVQHQKIEYQKTHDSLTQLPNRFSCEQLISELIAGAMRDSQNLVLLFINLDRFKQINDTDGHHIGDTLLQLVAQRLQLCIKHSDHVCRVGDDEFVIILDSISQLNIIDAQVQKVLANISDIYTIENKQYFLSCSVGISIYPDNGTSVETLLINAHNALNKARESGKNTYRYFSDEMVLNATRSLFLASSLRVAIDENAIDLYYQPQVDISNNRIIGLEALARWQHKEKGLVSPANFIPIAEYTGLIIPLGEQLLIKACSQIKLWQENQGFDGRVSVNISAKQLALDNFTDRIKSILQKTQCKPQWLELEVTESYFVDDMPSAIEKLSLLQSMGINIAIDDFGTGYSSLSYLKQLPVDRLKIDRSFVMDIDKDGVDRAIINAILLLARSMGLVVIAEGVENNEQKEYLKACKCNEVQGYLYSRPLHRDELSSLLADPYIKL